MTRFMLLALVVGWVLFCLNIPCNDAFIKSTESGVNDPEARQKLRVALEYRIVLALLLGIGTMPEGPDYKYGPGSSYWIGPFKLVGEFRISLTFSVSHTLKGGQVDGKKMKEECYKTLVRMAQNFDGQSQSVHESHLTEDEKATEMKNLISHFINSGSLAVLFDGERHQRISLAQRSPIDLVHGGTTRNLALQITRLPVCNTYVSHDDAFQIQYTVAPTI